MESAPVETLTYMVRADARSAQIGGPDDISHRFQVTSYSNEPRAPSLARNLFSKDCWNGALGIEAAAEEATHVGPEVPGVRVPFLLSRRGVGLAGT